MSGLLNYFLQEFSRMPLCWREAKVVKGLQIRAHSDRVHHIEGSRDHMPLASYTCSRLWPLLLYFLDWRPSHLPIKCWQF